MMIDGLLVFVDIDTQRDFLDPTGSLSIPGSGAIVANLGRLTQAARDRKIPVIATACAHTSDEADPEPFPPHCLVGTEGQKRIKATEWPGGRVLAPGERLGLGDVLPLHLTLEKTRYDIFSRMDAAEVFDRYASDFGPNPTFVVYGVATDYCVRAAVLGLRHLGHRVLIVVDAVWAIDTEAEAAELAQFVAAGATMSLTELVTPRSSEPLSA